MPTLRRFLIPTLVIIASTAIALLCAEGIVRAVYRSRVVLFPRYHSGAHYGDYHIRRLRPRTTFWHRSIDGSWKFVTNAQGFRDARDFSYAKPAGTVRVLCLGDSNTEGFEVRQERTFAAVLEQHLKRDGIRAEVINAGVSGFGTAEELVLLENEGIKYSPDAVVVGFVANDPGDNLRSGLFRVEADTLAGAAKEYVPGVRVLERINRFALMRWLSENSYLYSVGFNGLWEFYKSRLTKQRLGEAGFEYVERPAGDDLKRHGYEEELCRLLVERMYGFCRRNGIKLILLEIPSRHGEAAVPSIPRELVEAFRQNSDALIRAEDSLGDFRGASGVFVPHGHRHISEATHLAMGIAMAKKLEGLLGAARPAALTAPH
jgi:hypothetical protein